MEEIVKKALERLYDKIRSGDDINKEVNLSFDELIDKYYNVTEVKLPKNHICILRDIANNDNEFNKLIEYYRSFSEDSKLINFNTPCESCNLECCNNINVNFNFYSALFVMDLWNRRFLYSPVDNSKLLQLFFKQFYIDENEIKFDEDRMLKLFCDYDIEVIERELLNNDSLANIKTLLILKDYYLTIESRYNNLNNEKIKEVKPYIDFIDIKLEYYNNIYKIEKEEEKPKDKQDEIPFNFENNFDSVNETRVYNYFNESLVKRGYLSEKGLENYLTLAFDKTKFPKEKLQLEKKHIGKIRKIFYKYYTEINNESYGNKMRYAELLGNYFNGFDSKKVYDNFDK